MSKCILLVIFNHNCKFGSYSSPTKVHNDVDVGLNKFTVRSSRSLQVFPSRRYEEIWASMCMFARATLRPHLYLVFQNYVLK